MANHLISLRYALGASSLGSNWEARCALRLRARGGIQDSQNLQDSTDTPVFPGTCALSVIASTAPSTTFAFAPASARASIPCSASSAASSCSSDIALTPPECSTFTSRGHNNVNSLQYAAGWFGAPSIAFWTAVPEVSEQGRNKLAVQLLAVTRADRTAGRVSRPPWLKWHVGSSSCDSKLIVTLSISPLIIHENTRF